MSAASDPVSDDSGQAGITVTVYDDSDAVVGTSVTVAAGAYDLDLSVSAGTPFRSEFNWSEAWLTSGPLGDDNGSSVRFTEAGDCDIDFGV